MCRYIYIILYLRIHIAPLNSHGQTEVLLGIYILVNWAWRSRSTDASTKRYEVRRKGTGMQLHASAAAEMSVGYNF